MGGTRMIVISGQNEELIDTLPLTDLEKKIVNQKRNSPTVYRYDSLEALQFELKMRTNIVEAAKALEASDVSFATFDNSRCNNELWTRTNNGGFRLNSGVLPSDGINDIYTNGHLYAFECATAMVITLYKATLNVLGKEVFDRYFQDLYLRDWNYDSDLQLKIIEHKDDAYAGDIVYFKNPDHDPKSPEWQGENAVILGRDLYYGHGIGIRSAEEIIASLNRRRIPGSKISAYMSDEVVHPDFEYLRKLSIRLTQTHRARANQHHRGDIVARVGSHIYTLHDKR